VSRILIQRSDGMHSKARVSTIQAADQVLESWVEGASEREDNQCDVQIVFEDGFRYRSRFALRRTQKRISLARHVRGELSALAKSKKPQVSEVLDGEPIISPISGGIAESARLALDQYDI
jgi:hypothetical protein